MLDGIKAVLFDLDGTLVDSMWIWEDIDKMYMEKLNVEYKLSDLHENINGMSFTETAQFFKDIFNIEDSVEDIKDEWNNMAAEYYESKVPLKESARDFVEYLREKGIKTGIGTSNSRHLVSLVLDTHGMKDHFGTVRTSCEVNKGKPSPDIYLKVAEDLGVRPEECLVFEDIIEGVMAAKSAGMKACAVFDEYSKIHAEKLKSLADYYINDYREVLELIKDGKDEQISAKF